MNPRVRLYGAWVVLVACVIFWPVSMFTFAKEEPKAILSLSWGAMILTAIDIVSTTDVRTQQEGDDEAGEGE